VIRRPRWTSANIRLLKDAKRKGVELHWSSVTSAAMSWRAAFAAIQMRLFGSWGRALHAAGLDADDVVNVSGVDKASIIYELKLRVQDNER